MSGIIIYKTNSGSTKQYAQWINKVTSYRAVALADSKNIVLSANGIIIIGSLVNVYLYYIF